MVDRPADSDGDDWIARNYAQAPEIDSVTLVGARKLKAGEITHVKVTGTSGYDLTAKPVNQKSHRLRVLPG